METFDMIFVMFAWFLGAFVSGVTGLGCSLISLPLIALVIDSKDMILVSTLNGMVVGIGAAFMYRRFIDLRKDAIFWVFDIVGLMIGVWALKVMDVYFLQLILGVGAVYYVLWRFWQMVRGLRKAGGELNRTWCGIFGLVTGFFLGSSSVGAPPAVLYADLMHLDKDRARGFFVSGIFVYLLSLPVLWENGLINSNVLIHTGYTLPAMLLGLLAAVPVSRKIDQRTFNVCMLLLLGIASASLLIKVGAHYCAQP